MSTQNKTSNTQKDFLNLLWRNPDQVHFLGTIDRNKPTNFSNITANDDLTGQIDALSQEGIDIYFACAEYQNDSSRKADNVAGAWAFWADLDCGSEKAAAGKGYVNAVTAQAAIIDFADKLSLPQPNAIVNSGTGLHVYWILDSFIPQTQWQDAAKKFKSLMQQNGLLADPSRTADIASVMRFPGTMNHKYDPPLPVELIYLDETLIDTQLFLQQIDNALEVVDQDTITLTVDAESEADITDINDADDFPAPSMEAQPEYELDLDRLKSALTVLPADCSEYVWKFHRIAALANTAQEYPVLADDLFKLACDWSSGKLAGKPAVKWTKPSSATGKAGKDIIYSLWQRFIKDTKKGKKTSAGTIYYHAHQAGWNYDDQAGDIPFGGDNG
jgi:hypothetical protein